MALIEGLSRSICARCAAITSRAETSPRAICAASARALEKQSGEATGSESNTAFVYARLGEGQKGPQSGIFSGIAFPLVPMRIAAFAVAVALWCAAAVLTAQDAGVRPAATPSPAAAPATPAGQKALVDQYCATCHNARVKSGGLALD